MARRRCSPAARCPARPEGAQQAASVARHRGVYTDVVCAWSTVALHRFYQQRRQAGLEDRVGVEHRLVLLEDVNRFPVPERYLDAEILVVGELAPELEWKPWQNHPSP